MSRVAVIGAGPAGSSVGYHLAKSGHYVELIDKQSFPRDKACGDGITYNAIEALSTMGIDRQYLQKFASEFYLWNGAILGIQDRDYYCRFSDNNFDFCIPRYVFDDLIYCRAIEAGCIPTQKSVVNITEFSIEHKEEFDYIVDARGIFSGECDLIGIREYWTIPLDYFPHNYSSNLQIYFDKALGADGYFWIFPVSCSHNLLKLNVGLGFTIKEYKKHKQNLIGLFDNFIVNHRVSSVLLDHTLDRTGKKVYPLATTKWNNKIYEGNIFKIGDAANLTDPLTGEGIGNALYSGFYLSQAINQGNDLKTVKFIYKKLYRKHFENRLKKRLIQRNILSFPIINKCLIEIASSTHLPKSMIQAFTGFS